MAFSGTLRTGKDNAVRIAVINALTWVSQLFLLLWVAF